MEFLKQHGHCKNCLKPGHFIQQFPCGQKCRKCQRPRHTWLHIEKEPLNQINELSPSKQTLGLVTHDSDLGDRHPVVLTRCKVQIESGDGSTTKARALLDSASFTSFITESLAQHLHLRHRCHSMKVGGIGSSETRLPSHRMVDLNISNHRGKTGSEGNSDAQGHHPSTTLSSPIQSQMEAIVKYPSG